MDIMAKAALINAVMIGSGGFLGTLARFGLNGFIQRQLPSAVFPYGTLAVNLMGCFLIGSVAGFAEERQFLGQEIRAVVLIGVLGGFTTFSTFGYDTFEMLRDGNYARAMYNAGIHVALGVALVWLGHTLTTSR